MKKRILGFLFCLLSLPSLATTTVSGHLSTLGTGNSTSSNNAFVRFKLIGCRGNQPRITGTGAIAPTLGKDNIFYVDLDADSSGNVSGTIYSTRDAAGTGNGDIECGGSYTGTYYNMAICANGVCGPDVPITAKSGVSLDPSSVTPNSTQPVVAAPTGDGTYLRLDAGNSPVTGALTLGAAITANSSLKPNADDANALGDSTHRWTASLGTATAKNLGGVRYADQFTGSDIGAQINAAYADLPTAGGRIYVPAGSYSFSTPIVIGTANKFAELICPASTSTTLTYTGTGTTVAVTWNPGNAGLPSGTGIKGCKFLGPSSAGTTVGLVVGGSNGAVGAHFEDVDISGFGTGLKISSNTQELDFEHIKVADNGQNFLYPSGLTGAGEHINFHNSTIAMTSATWSATCFQVASGAAGLPMINVTDSNIDQCGITLGSGSNTFTNLHMENTVNVAFGGTAYIAVSGGTATFINPMLIAQQTNQPAEMITAHDVTAVIFGADIENTGSAITNMITVSGGGSAQLYGTRFTSGFTNLLPAGYPRIDNLATYLRGVTTPDQIISSLATGTAPLSVSSTTPVAHLTTVPAAYDNAGTQQTEARFVKGACTLGTNCAITLAGSAVFTSNTSYDCWPRDVTTPANAVTVVRTSGSSLSFTGTGTDVIDYLCVGN